MNFERELKMKKLKVTPQRIAILKPKMDGNEQISKLSASIVKEQERLAKLSEYQTQLNTVQAQYKQNLNELSKSFSIGVRVEF